MSAIKQYQAVYVSYRAPRAQREMFDLKALSVISCIVKDTAMIFGMFATF